MKSSSIVRVVAVLASSIAILGAAALPAPSLAAKGPRPPRVATGPATHVLGTSALLTGTVIPDGVEVGYFFRYGTTTGYGSQTPTVGVATSATKLKVGQSVGGLQAGVTYHYRIYAVSPSGAILAEGRDHTFKAKGTALAFTVKRVQQATYGAPFILDGRLTGLGSPAHRIALQASPYPYLEPFATIGIPGVTNSLGNFSFRVSNLSENTQMRVTTLDPLPVYSQVITVQVQVRVTLHVRSSTQRGVVRLYGTIAPAVNGAKVSLQVQKAVRPGRSEATERWVSQFTTTAKRNGSGSSRFSIVATVHHGGRYRAYVKVPNGKLAPGASTTTIVLHAA